ncbi:tetratricopeptide repeat protein [Croceiramulus getboli]|nr:tetratricopeptide repeat protein [Flavobacteriaceae bacterium YJPT1-3]
MKTKITLLLLAIVASSATMFGQASEECLTQGSIFSENMKVKNYDAAWEPFQFLMKNCPTWSPALYQYGEILVREKIEGSTGAKKEEYAGLMADVIEQRMKYYPNKTKVGDKYADLAQVMYDNKMGTKEKQFNMFQKAWDEDKETFTSAKSLYTYFSLVVDLQDEGKKDLQDVFDLYDAVTEQISKEQNDLAKRIEPLLEKQENNENLTSKEAKLLKNAEINLKAYATVSGSIDSKLGQLADCDNLIPLYSKDFNEKMNDVSWVRKAAGRLSGKDCTSDPLFVKLVEQLDKLEPSANTALYLGQLAEEKGDLNKALDYYNESAERQTDNLAKSKVYFRIGEKLRGKGSYGQARSYYQKALEQNPSMGINYLRIANMYAASANNCGSSVFEKRAVYWLAADVAARAGRVDPSLSSAASQTAASYRAKAPDNTMIFNESKGGQTISIGCWIGRSVRVPNL